MAGAFGKRWIGVVVAVVLIAAAGVIVVSRRSGGSATPGRTGDTLRVCLKHGTKFLAPAAKPGQEPAKCPQCGGETVAALVFECANGHLFVGYLQKPAPPESIESDDEYVRHQPLALRPGLDAEWVPGGLSRPPACPVCGTGMRRPVVGFQGIQVEDIKMGQLPSPGDAG